jgi:hypothetical protein
MRRSLGGENEELKIENGELKIENVGALCATPIFVLFVIARNEMTKQSRKRKPVMPFLTRHPPRNEPKHSEDCGSSLQ